MGRVEEEDNGGIARLSRINEDESFSGSLFRLILDPACITITSEVERSSAEAHPVTRGT